MDSSLSDVLADPERLAAVRQAALAEPAAQEAFDRLSSLATRILNVPVALVSLVDEERQVFRGCVGLPEPWASQRETPLSHSFCQHVAATEQPLVVEDAREHPMLCENLAIRDLDVVAYLGIPLITSTGQAIGSFCAIDLEPRRWTDEDVRLLSDLAVSVMTEIELRQAAQALAEEQRQRTSVLEATDEGIYGIDLRGRCTFLNAAGAETLGYEPEEVIGRNMHDLIHHTLPDGSPHLEEACPIYRALRTGHGVRVEEDILSTKNGDSFPVTYASFPVREDGEIRGAVVTFRDISERLRVEEELRLREERYRLATRATNDIIWDWDLESGELYWNQAMEQVFGYRLEEIRGDVDWWSEHIHPDERERVTAGMQEALESGRETWSDEYRFRQRNGSYAVVLDRGLISRDAEGRPVRMIGSMLDVTEHRRREEAERFLSETSRVLVSSLDFDITLRSLANLLIPRLGDLCAIHLVAEDGAVLQVICESADRVEPGAMREWLERNSGGELPPGPARDALRSEQPVFLPDLSIPINSLPGTSAESVVAAPLIARGHTLGVLSLYITGSDRRFTSDDLALLEEVARRAALAVDNGRLLREAELAQAEAEAANRAKSEFLARMSHELRTPINAVVGYTELLEMGIGGDVSDKQRRYLERIRTSNQHLLSLIEEVLDLAKIESGRMSVARERGDVGRVAREAIDLVRPQAEARSLELERRCAAEGVVFHGDEDRVRQILVNLLSNAAKFTDPGGRITVTCGTVTEPEPGARLRGGGPWSFVRVEDTGMGIEREQLDAIFEAFVQVEVGLTRRRGGTGLGLTISRQFARLMGGDLTVRSTPGIGSAFTLWLPAVEPRSRPAGEDRAEVAIRTSAEPRSLLAVAHALQGSNDAIVDACMRRLRADPEITAASGMRDAELEDHLPTFLTELGISVSALATRIAIPDLLSDASEILHLIAERHGAQRARHAWTEAELRREYEIVEEEVLAALQRSMGTEALAAAGRAVRALRDLLGRAEAISLKRIRFAG